MNLPSSRKLFALAISAATIAGCGGRSVTSSLPNVSTVPGSGTRATHALALPVAMRPSYGRNAVVAWNSIALQAIRDTHPGPPMVARMLAILNTCIYDAWAAYDSRATASSAAPCDDPKPSAAERIAERR